MGGRFAIGTASGTDAIALCLREAGIVHRSQKVMLPSHTSLFTAQAVLAAGATPRLVDIDSTRMLVDPEAVERNWTTDTAAVVCVHLYGQPANLPALAEICRRKGAVLVQDACQAHGASCQGQSLASFSDYVAYSFYPTKNLGALGDGGCVVTNNPHVARRLRLLRDGGRVDDQIARAPAINSRLDEMQCCYLRAFLEDLEHWNRHRSVIAHEYHQLLGHLDGLHLDLLQYQSGSVFHLYVVRVRDQSQRPALQSWLRGRGVQTGVHYPVPVHAQPGLRRYCEVPESPIESERAAARVLSLPIGPHISKEDANQIARQITEFYSS
jgi:dTDP-4-amino-4,6-dideoxygalactose transaminase